MCPYPLSLCFRLFVLSGCVPVGVYVAATTVPTDPPAQRATVQGLTMPCARWEWDSSPWVSSWLFGLSFRWTERTPVAHPLCPATPRQCLIMVMRSVQTAQSPQQWLWCWLESGQPCCFYPFVSVWGVRGESATEVASQRQQESSSWTMSQGSRKDRESWLVCLWFIIFLRCCQFPGVLQSEIFGNVWYTKWLLSRSSTFF